MQLTKSLTQIVDSSKPRPPHQQLNDRYSESDFSVKEQRRSVTRTRLHRVCSATLLSAFSRLATGMPLLKAGAACALLIGLGFGASALGQVPLVPPPQTAGITITEQYLNSPNNWSYLKDTFPTGKFLNPRFTRLNAGENWSQIETGPDVWDPNFGSLYGSGGWLNDTQRQPTVTDTNSGDPGVLFIYTINDVPTWANSSGLGHAPYDINNPNETCRAVSASGSGGDPAFTSPTGDCFTLEFAEGFFQKTCHLSQKPTSPVSDQCDIHYFEGFNEATGSNWSVEPSCSVNLADCHKHDAYYWTWLAKMDVDFQRIMKQYCADCYMAVGSVACGGDTSTAGTEYTCVTATQAWIEAWKSESAIVNAGQLSTTNPPASYPDFVTYHPYPALTNVYPMPFPETNISGDGSGNGTTGDSRCSIANEPPNVPPNTNHVCDYPVIATFPAFQSMLASEGLTTATKEIPVIGTEAGPYSNAQLYDDATDPMTGNPYTDTHQAAYAARLNLLLAYQGSSAVSPPPTSGPAFDLAANLWYQFDNCKFGTLYGGIDNAQNPTCAQIYSGNTKDVVPNGLTAAGQGMLESTLWLNGSSFSSGGCTGTAFDGHYQCGLRLGTTIATQLGVPTGTYAEVVWSTTYEPTYPTSYSTGYGHWMDIWGNSGAVANGAIRLNETPSLLY